MRRVAIACVLAGFALGGCGAGAAPTTTHPVSSTPKPPPAVARADRTHEYGSDRPPAQSVPAAARSPVAAVTAFANAYINWNASNVAADMRLLAAASLGQARSEMQLAAAHAAQDYELQRGGIANSGQVQAVARLPHSNDHYAVVTLERTSASPGSAYQGLPAAWHVTVATVSPYRGGWVISGWQPEN